MDNFKIINDENLVVSNQDECPNCKSKKYKVHGKVVAGDKPGSIEVSYYECDNIECKKIFIRKS